MKKILFITFIIAFLLFTGCVSEINTRGTLVTPATHQTIRLVPESPVPVERLVQITNTRTGWDYDDNFYITGIVRNNNKWPIKTWVNVDCYDPNKEIIGTGHDYIMIDPYGDSMYNVIVNEVEEPKMCNTYRIYFSDVY